MVFPTRKQIMYYDWFSPQALRHGAVTGSGVFRLQHSPPRDNDEIREFLLFSCDIHCSGDVCSRSHVWLVGKGFDHDRLDTKCTVFIYGWQCRHVRTNKPIQKQQWNSFSSTGFAPLFMTGFYIWVWKIIKLYTIYNLTTDPLHSGSPDSQNSWKLKSVPIIR